MQKIHTYKGLVPGVLIKRYKRFLADVRLESGEVIKAFCPNSGSMMGLASAGYPVMLTYAPSPTRKTAYTLEMVKPGRSWVGVNTHLTNYFAEALVRDGLLGGTVLDGYEFKRREVTVGKSRLDILLSRGEAECYVEVKSVTLRREGKLAEFPDAVTTRGAKHLRELEGIVAKGGKATMMYVVQRADCNSFRPAEDIDPDYAHGLRQALDRGVGIVVCGLSIGPSGAYFRRVLEYSDYGD